MSVIFGEIRSFPQGDGPDVRLRVFGDEFYARYENEEGYTVVYDPNLERYCFAVRVQGHLISSGVPVMKRPPQGLRRHLQEDKSIRNRKLRENKDKTYPLVQSRAGIMGVRGPNDGLLSGRRLSRGKIFGLTVLVDFRDVQTDIKAEEIDALLNKDDYTANRNACSVREYFMKMSSGKLDYTNVVVGPVTLSHSRAHYINNSFVAEALELVAHEQKIDLSRFDSRSEGIVDAVNFFYAGRSVYENRLWPHNWKVEWAAGHPLRYDGITFNQYMMTGMGRKSVELNIGTICHETGHLLCRFPDLYDYGTRAGDSDPSAGLGHYCLMAAGGRLDYGRSPSPVCAYLRDLVQWYDKEITLNQPGIFRARHEDFATLYRFETERANEYFLVENRTRMGLDAFLPSSGLAVYHCDTLGSNEWQGGDPERHYQCALLQADGSLDLETNRNFGDMTDLFGKMVGVALSHDTTPNTRKWDGSESGFNILDIGEPGDIIRFKTGRAGDQGETDISDSPVVVQEVFPDLLIPDDAEEGICNMIRVDKPGRIASMNIEVDISHSNIGDLEVSLINPNGNRIMFHNRDWGEQGDLRRTYDTQSRLAPLKGLPMQGTWGLCVKDLAAGDIGRLNRWKLTIRYEPTDRIIQGEAVSGLRIPDADWNGITSAIPIEQEGVAAEIQIHVEITHTYIGDLQIAVAAPTGEKIVLMPFGEGGNKANVRRTYDSTNHPGLAALINAGQRMEGDWILQVIDNTPGDTGVLEKWSLALTF